MRFDILDEYSALVPLGLGVPRSKPYPASHADAISSTSNTSASIGSGLGSKLKSLVRHCFAKKDIVEVHK